MVTDGIGGLGAATRAFGDSTPSPTGGGDGFGDVLASLGDVQSQADAAVVDLATGGGQDLHDAVLAVEMESISFDLAVQIRNRLVDAYQEIFRMSV